MLESRNEKTPQELEPGEKILEIINLSKGFPQSEGTLRAVDKLNLEVRKGEIFGIIGLSGAGKSTLLRCINLLEKPDEGEILLYGESLTALSEKELRERRKKIAMIFQSFNLFLQRTVLDNVIYPLTLSGHSKAAARKRAVYLLELMGLQDKIKAWPSQLSGGQKQRVGIARALANKPYLLLSDEATSALDPSSTEDILSILEELNQELGLTIVLITHQMEVVSRICDRVALMEEGKIVEQGLVRDVFRNPRSTMARDFILPKGALFDKASQENLVRISFDGHESSAPLFAQMVLDTSAAPSILSANSHAVEGISYGNLIIQLPDPVEEKAAIIQWLDKHHLNYDFVSHLEHTGVQS